LFISFSLIAPLKYSIQWRIAGRVFSLKAAMPEANLN